MLYSKHHFGRGKAMDNYAEEKKRLTEAAIKDGFLAALKNKPFSSVTVSEICRVARVSRGTFYRRYENIPTILQDVFSDMTAIISSIHEQVTCPSGMNCRTSLCQFIRENEKYACIILDPFLSEKFIEYSAENKEDYIADTRTDLTEIQRRTLKEYLLAGCIHVIRRNIRTDDTSWADLRGVIDDFIRSGIQNEKAPAKH